MYTHICVDKYTCCIWQVCEARKTTLIDSNFESSQVRIDSNAAAATPLDEYSACTCWQLQEPPGPDFVHGYLITAPLATSSTDHIYLIKATCCGGRPHFAEVVTSAAWHAAPELRRMQRPRYVDTCTGIYIYIYIYICVYIYMHVDADLPAAQRKASVNSQFSERCPGDLVRFQGQTFACTRGWH